MAPQEGSDYRSRGASVVHTLCDSTLYCGAGVFLGTATLCSWLAGGIAQGTPWGATVGRECLLAGRIFGTAALHSFATAFKRSTLPSLCYRGERSSYSAWEENKALLSQIAVHSQEDRELVHFLQRRWLARLTGCYPFLVDWMCPTFGIRLQMHPETTNAYARDPGTKSSDTYKLRVQAWKELLPHPQDFPLVLTRPCDVTGHLPCCFTVDRLEGAGERDVAIVDVTALLPEGGVDRGGWLEAWRACEGQLVHRFREWGLDLSKILCIQRVGQREVGGIRLLPFADASRESVEGHHQYLLEWVSRYGLTANRIELDRFVPATGMLPRVSPSVVGGLECKRRFVSYLGALDLQVLSDHPQKMLLFKGALQVLQDLCAHLSDQKWEEALSSDARFSVVQLSVRRIEQAFSVALQKRGASLQEVIPQVEQIYADVGCLLEIFSPFSSADFQDAYRCYLTTIPQRLQPMTRYGLHASAMTSLGGILGAMPHPRVLYGENTYFEGIDALSRLSKASSVVEAKEEDWEEVDLIIAQFNPTVKRINFEVTEYQASEYHAEKIAAMVHRALSARRNKPLSLAVDCTLDFIDSPRVGALLTEFQQAIVDGRLNVMGYRSGLKFDLFGMDNYCGAPFFIVHNGDAKWAAFERLVTDPVLQTDRLSTNWFALAYQNAAPYLEMYRKQIFDNTRAVLDKIPAQLYSETNQRYRVIPVAPDADPTFVDIKIFGPLHTFRGELLVGVFLTVKCMQAGYPLLYRPGIGFTHPNLAVLFGKECTTVRLTIGLDPEQIAVVTGCLETLAALN